MKYNNSYEFYKSIFGNDNKELFQLFKSAKSATLKTQRETGIYTWKKARAAALENYPEAIRNNYELYAAIIKAIAENKKKTVKYIISRFTYNDLFSVMVVLNTIEHLYLYDKEMREAENKYICEHLQNIGKARHEKQYS